MDLLKPNQRTKLYHSMLTMPSQKNANLTESIKGNNVFLIQGIFERQLSEVNKMNFTAITQEVC